MISRRQHGFTLVELSVVLVIVGLLIGGVLVGRDLIEAAKMRKQAEMPNKILTAYTLFKTKYSCMPGDCPNATTFFTASGTCPSFSATDTTCNGNGDTQIKNTSINETIQFMQHLKLANLVSWPWISSEANLPKDSILGQRQYFVYFDDNSWWSAYPWNTFYYWKLDAGDTYLSADILSQMDRKFDDGIAFGGKMRIMPEEIDQSNELACVDEDDNYRSGDAGATTNYCHTYFELMLTK